MKQPQLGREPQPQTSQHFMGQDYNAGQGFGPKPFLGCGLFKGHSSWCQ